MRTGRRPLVVIRGAGDLASGVAARLARSGFGVVLTEIERPLALRRLVAFAEAVYQGRVRVEELEAECLGDAGQAEAVVESGRLAVLVDPAADCVERLRPLALIDARMRKAPPEPEAPGAPLRIGLGPGFTAGLDCEAVIETRRGHSLGRVIWQGQAAPDSGVPEPVSGYAVERVLRAPAAGQVVGAAALGEVVRRGQVIGHVGSAAVVAPFEGALRGFLHNGLAVSEGAKIGDLDPRADPRHCREISDKALAVGGGALEALLSRPAIRGRLGGCDEAG